MDPSRQKKKEEGRTDLTARDPWDPGKLHINGVNTPRNDRKSWVSGVKTLLIGGTTPLISGRDPLCCTGAMFFCSVSSHGIVTIVLLLQPSLARNN